ncbi:hypothetical protein BD626DRAFT_461987 [Schizophyllum amplum]|uniref:DUF6593 domain-containing protein n=1 Tax=Schizophyllum amplum TaxID=97359 RepID=A0A550C5D7_9AGAR|nr:hypothetical protein BD626DRAFT_461987 [Auriculariopsis ampla]
MDLYFLPNNPVRATIISANDVAHFRVTTRNGVTRVQRPAESEDASIVAEIHWNSWESPTVVQSQLLSKYKHSEDLKGVRATDFLYKRARFSSSRYFVGNDGQEYRWKTIPRAGLVLTQIDTSEEVARFFTTVPEEGVFKGERRMTLRIQACNLDVELIFLTFLILEKKRRDGMDGSRSCAHDEDPQGDGGEDGGSGSG